ncbi:MAG: hypothetical protein WDA53_00965 [Bacillota bacterium]
MLSDLGPNELVNIYIQIIPLIVLILSFFAIKLGIKNGVKKFKNEFRKGDVLK